MIKTWSHKATITDGQKFEIDGINIWDYVWSIPGERALIQNPHDSQKFSVLIKEINAGNKRIRFAAYEFSNGVWGIFY